jgi:hypothetical protein
MNKHKSNTTPIIRRLFYIGLGILTIYLGIHYYVQQWDYRYGFRISKVAGLMLSAFGVLILLYGFFRGSIPKKYEDNFVICKTCLKSFNAKSITNSICPECGGHIEKLDGFYDRHPELR